MCGVSLREEKSSDECLGRPGIVGVADVVQKGRTYSLILIDYSG